MVVALCQPPAAASRTSEELGRARAEADIQFTLAFAPMVSFETESEARAWCSYLECSFQELKRAVAAVGKNRSKVEDFLAAGRRLPQQPMGCLKIWRALQLLLVDGHGRKKGVPQHA